MGIDLDLFVAECPRPVVVVDDRGIMAQPNRALASVLGYGLDELEGRSIAALLPSGTAPPESSPWPRFLAELSVRRPVLTLVHRSGVHLDSRFEVLAGHDAHGRDVALVSFHPRPGSLKDERGAGEAGIAQQVHAIVFHSAPIGIYHFDPSGIITECNEPFVALIGSSRQALIGLHIRSLPNRDVVAVHEAALAGDVARFEGLYVPATGTRSTWIRLVVSPTRDASGQVSGGVGIVEDIGEAHRARELVARTERLTALGTLAAGVAHEMKNPLAYAVTNVDLALRRVGPEHPVRPLLEAAGEGLARATAIVRDLRTFAMKDDAPRSAVRLSAVVDSAIKLALGAIAGRAHVDRRVIHDGVVLAAEGRLVQVVVNLLINAADAIATQPSPADDTITVTLDEDAEGRATIEVRDHGPGLGPEAASRLFEPFWTGKESGLGLGLPLCHGIVSSLGGEITLADPLPGERGARFVVALPRAVGEPPRSSKKPALPSEASQGAGSHPAPVAARRARVLVIDDEPRLAETLRLALEPEHEVTALTRGRDALDRLLADPSFDVVLCDLLLPDVIGPRIFAEATARHPELAGRFVFLTGGAFNEELATFLQGVDNPRLEKPFTLTTLEKVVADVASRRLDRDA